MYAIFCMKTNYLLLTAAIAISSICTYLIANNRDAINELQDKSIQLSKTMDTLKTTIDSLNNEVFIFKTNQERYEIAIEMFKEENPKGYDQLQYIISHKTE